MPRSVEFTVDVTAAAGIGRQAHTAVTAILPEAEQLGGQPCNYYPDRDGRIAELDSGAVTSSVLLARLLPGTFVVRAFNNIDYLHLGTLARPSGVPDRSALPIAADDPSARDRVAALLDTLGYDAVDIGPLAECWRSQPDTPVYVQPYMSPRPEGMTRQESAAWFMSSPGTPVPADTVRRLVDSAVIEDVAGDRLADALVSSGVMVPELTSAFSR